MEWGSGWRLEAGGAVASHAVPAHITVSIVLANRKAVMSAGSGQDRNPYRPGAAIRPVFLAGRDAEQRRFRAVLAGSPQLPANVRITGLRGVGKSVLLKRLEELADDAGLAGTLGCTTNEHSPTTPSTRRSADQADPQLVRQL